MGFIILLFLTTLSIAGSAAFFSVYGLARVFSGAFWSIIFMGASLEAGKLIAASYLYRFWSTLTRAMRAYLLTAVIALMCITSMGIFGYLTSAFQDNILPFDQQTQQIQILEADKAEAEKLKTERLTREEEINKQIANLPDNYVNGRNKLMNANKEELQQIRKDIADYTNTIRADSAKIAELKSQVLQETAHVGPIIFIAQVFGADVKQATKWLIILIISVFDPLAVVLTIGTNMAMIAYRKKKAEEPGKKQEPETKTEDAPVITANVPVVVQDVVGEQSEFQKAHELFNKDNLTPHEQRIKETIEQTIKQYSKVLEGNK